MSFSPIIVYSSETQTGPKAVLKDLKDGLAMGPVWRAFAWDEVQNRYRRSAIGILWIGISYLFFVAAIAFIFGGFASMNSNGFLQHVAIGYAAFTFLLGNVVDGCTVFNTARNWIKSSSLPYSIYIYKSIARSIFPFVIQLLVAFGIMLMMGWRPDMNALMVFPAVIIYFVCAVPLQLLLGLISARWRDVKHLIGAFTRVLFFLTPILWVYGERPGHIQKVADINPFTHFVEIFRSPLLGTQASMTTWTIVLCWTVILWISSIAAASFMSRRLPIWV